MLESLLIHLHHLNLIRLVNAVLCDRCSLHSALSRNHRIDYGRSFLDMSALLLSLNRWLFYELNLLYPSLRHRFASLHNNSSFSVGILYRLSIRLLTALSSYNECRTSVNKWIYRLAVWSSLSW